MQFRRDIQGLRAVAFILVYIFHLNSSWLPGGFIGVDMFFVISGYLITSIITDQKQKGHFRLLSFYEKRIKRIIPAYYVTLLFIIIAGCYFYLQTDTPRLRSGLYRSIVFLSNQFFAHGDSYFGAKLSENPLLHTWSLAIEMQFYFILPFLLIYTNKKILPYLIGTLLFILTAHSTYILYYSHNFSSVYFSLLSRIPEFCVGVLLSLLFSKVKPPSFKISTVISILGFVGIMLSAFFINENTPFPGVIALIPCLAAGLLLISGDNFVSKFLSSKPMVYIGELSYSLYLWHWPIMAYLRYNNVSHNEFSAYEVVLITILTFVFSWLSYVYVESIFRNQRNKTFVILFLPIVLAVAVLTIKLPSINMNETLPKHYNMTAFGEASHAQDSIETFGSTHASKKNIALIGDSHAHVLKAFLDFIGKKNDFSFKTITTSGFPALEGLRQEDFEGENLKRFLNSQQLMAPTKKLINESDVILINSLDFNRIPSLRDALEGLAKNLKENQKLVIFLTVPVYNVSPLRINKGITKNTNRWVGDLLPVNREKNAKIVQDIAGRYVDVYVYDLSVSKIFDDGPFYQDTILYYDHSHINLYGALNLAREEEEKFMLLINDLLDQ